MSSWKTKLLLLLGVFFLVGCTAVKTEEPDTPEQKLEKAIGYAKEMEEFGEVSVRYHEEENAIVIRPLVGGSEYQLFEDMEEYGGWETTWSGFVESYAGISQSLSQLADDEELSLIVTKDVTSGEVVLEVKNGTVLYNRYD